MNKFSSALFKIVKYTKKMENAQNAKKILLYTPIKYFA